MDVTPLVPAGRRFVHGYGDGRFRIGGVVHEGSVLVLSGRTLGWTVGGIGELTAESLAPVLEEAAEIEILLLGTGSRAEMVSASLRRTVREAGIVIEAMETGAACRTYNVLLSEGRRVAAALIAV